MAKPVYIICAESFSQDISTNLMSFFHVLEGFDLQVKRIPEHEQTENLPSQDPTNVHLVCVWVRESEDLPDRTYEWQLVLRRLNGEVSEQSINEFQFTRPFYRIHARIGLNIPPVAESGTVELSIRIRPRGTADWQIQTYPLPVNVIVAQDEGAFDTVKEHIEKDL